MDTPDSTKTESRPKVILFDVYETLLDMSEIRTKLNRLLDSKKGFIIWFDTLLQYSWLDNSTGQYHSFAVLADLAMDAAAKTLSERLNAEQKEAVLRLMQQLPVHEDVQTGLSRLRDSGYRLATLTNAPAAAITGRMQRTGLISYFDAILSVESVKKHKPATETYQWAAQTLGVQTNEVLMVSAHGWDIAGALHAGMPAAFIERRGQTLYPLAPQPVYSEKDLIKLADTLQSLPG